MQFTKFLLPLSFILLSGCEKPTLSCDDPAVFQTLNKVFLENLRSKTYSLFSEKDGASINEDDLQIAMFWSSTRPTSVNKEIRQIGCSSTVWYELKDAERATKGIEEMTNLAAAFEYGDVMGRKDFVGVAEAFSQVYDGSIITLPIQYTAQVTSEDRVYVEFNVPEDSFRAFQMILVKDQKSPVERPFKFIKPE